LGEGGYLSFAQLLQGEILFEIALLPLVKKNEEKDCVTPYSFFLHTIKVPMKKCSSIAQLIPVAAISMKVHFQQVLLQPK
jgi:hypothetical protein